MNKYEVVKFVNDEITLDVSVSPKEETVWLTTEQISKLFHRNRSVISKHINEIYSSGELDKNSTCAKNAHMGHEGKQTYQTKLFNLDVIISVGYRVKSKQAVVFRKWATSVLKDYLLKGYSISNRAIITKDNYLTLANKVLELDKDVNFIKREIKMLDPDTHIFYSGEYYKSHVFIYKILKESKNNLIVIDPYIDSNIFDYLKFINKEIKCVLIYSDKSKISTFEIENYNKKGFKFESCIDNSYHDRFIVIDNKIIYHIGTSFNYLGAKTFLINKVNDEKWVKSFIKKDKNMKINSMLVVIILQLS